MVNIRPLTPELQKIAIDQLHEVPERIPDDIQALKTWIEQQPHLRARTDDQFLLAFLRGCKFSLEKAKSKIDKYYTLKTKFPDLFACNDYDDPEVQDILKLGTIVKLPNPLFENGPRIILARFANYDPAKYNIERIMRVFTGIHEISMMEDDVGLINGFVYISDLSTMTMQHFFQMTPTVMKKMAVYTEEALPLRPKMQHMIHAHPAFEGVFNTLKPFIPKKQLERMMIHGHDLTGFYEKVPQKYLPKEYGGENGSIEQLLEEMQRKVASYKEFFKENDDFGTDEFLRPGEPIDFEGLFGLEGSFRKLNVD